MPPAKERKTMTGREFFGNEIIDASLRGEKVYMEPATGSVDTYDGWWYEDENGNQVNGVDRGELVEVYWDDDVDNWEEASR